MDILKKIASEHVRSDRADFRPGDTVRVHCRILEGDKERVQLFEGVVIRRRNAGIASMFTVRKHAYGVGVERVFPLHSPLIEKIDVLNKGKVRRAHLTYLRKRSGKAARIESQMFEEAEAAVEASDASPPQ